MKPSKLKLLFARLFGVGALFCGVIGLYVGLADKVWKLGIVGWFTGGTLLAALSVLILVDMYVVLKRQGVL